MSTNAIIAEPYGDQWRGRYHHWDGYPSGLGKTLWAKVHELGVNRVRQFLLHEHEHWSTVIGGSDALDWSLPPGYGDGPQAKCYCHGTRSERGEWEARTIAVYDCAHWVYVLGDGGMTIEHRRFLPLEWKTIGFYAWESAEPDWEKIEEDASA